MKHSSRLVVALSLALLPFACSSNDQATPGTSRDAGADTGAGGAAGGKTGAGGAYGTDAGKVTCGGTLCKLPIGGGIERLKLCCTADDKCGLLEPGIDKCMVPNEPGSITAPTCPRPTFKTPGGSLLAPCCGPNGCGAMDPFLGCIPGPELGAPAVACTYDPTNDCTALTSVTCDGAEDCPTGQRCCAKLVGMTTYVEVGCFDSCSALTDGGSPFRWLELCHDGDTCESSAFSCLQSTVLPAPLARCDNAIGGSPASPTADKSAHHVDCGASVCGDGEKCCVRTPHAPYCAKATDSCECHPGDAGAAGAGGTDSGATLPDAAPDSSTDVRDAAPAPRDASRG